jgi:RNA polymerase sigma-70 factor (ECF subfamily)
MEGKMAVGKSAARGTRSEAQERLMVQAAQKDPSRFADLYEDNFDLVYGYIIRRVRERVVAEDLTSEVFHKALASLPNFDWRGVPFGAWLIRIAFNVLADEWKRSSRELVVDELPEMSTEPKLDEGEDYARLFRAVEGLPTDQRRVVHMRFAEGKSIREIAEELKRTEGAVKQLQFRALQNLRARVEGANG